MAEPLPTMQAVESTMVGQVGYDANTNTFYARYRKGGLYRYEAVPQRVWDGLWEASSKGTYLQTVILGKYRHTKIEG